MQLERPFVLHHASGFSVGDCYVRKWTMYQETAVLYHYTNSVHFSDIQKCQEKGYILVERTETGRIFVLFNDVVNSTDLACRLVSDDSELESTLKKIVVA
jgi:hypothetical protein